MFDGERLMTLSTSLVARDDGLVGKGSDQLDLLIGKRTNLKPVDDQDAYQIAGLQHRNCQYRSDRIYVRPAERVLRVSPNIRDMDRPLLERRSCNAGMPAWRDRVPRHKLHEFRGRVMRRLMTKDRTVTAVDECAFRVA